MQKLWKQTCLLLVFFACLAGNLGAEVRVEKPRRGYGGPLVTDEEAHLQLRFNRNLELVEILVQEDGRFSFSLLYNHGRVSQLILTSPANPKLVQLNLLFEQGAIYELFAFQSPEKDVCGSIALHYRSDHGRVLEECLVRGLGDIQYRDPEPAVENQIKENIQAAAGLVQEIQRRVKNLITPDLITKVAQYGGMEKMEAEQLQILQKALDEFYRLDQQMQTPLAIRWPQPT